MGDGAPRLLRGGSTTSRSVRVGRAHPRRVHDSRRPVLRSSTSARRPATMAGPRRRGPRDRAALRRGADARDLPEPAWAGLLRVASTAERDTRARGRARGRPRAAPAAPLGSPPRRAAADGPPPQCVLLRRKRFLTLGGSTGGGAGGPPGPGPHVLERSLAAGDVVGYQEAAGLGVATCGPSSSASNAGASSARGRWVPPGLRTPGAARDGLLRAPRGGRARRRVRRTPTRRRWARRSGAACSSPGASPRCSPLSGAVRRSSARAATARPCPRRAR